LLATNHKYTIDDMHHDRFILTTGIVFINIGLKTFNCSNFYISISCTVKKPINRSRGNILYLFCNNTTHPI